MRASSTSPTTTSSGISGPDRLTWLHNLTTQYFLDLAPGVETQALILSPQGHVEHEFRGTDDGEAFTAWTEPGASAALVEFLERMKFMTRVEITDETAALALTWRPSTGYRLVPARRSSRRTPRPPGPAAGSVGLRGAAHRSRRGALRPRHRPPLDPQRDGLDRPGRAPRQGLLPRPGDGRARAHPRPPAAPADPAAPRRLREQAARRAAPTCCSASKVVGYVGSSARHHELGPIALAVLKRNTPVDAPLLTDGIDAAQEVVVDPEVGLHVRPACGERSAAAPERTRNAWRRRRLPVLRDVHPDRSATARGRGPLLIVFTKNHGVNTGDVPGR